MTETDQALLAAARRLRSADRLEAELRAWLGEEGYSEPAVEGAVARLRAKGLLSDKWTVAETLDRKTRRGFAVRAIVDELRERGAPEHLLAEAEPEGELKQALAALEAKRPPAHSPAAAARYLASRGYAEETVQEVIERLYPWINDPPLD